MDQTDATRIRAIDAVRGFAVLGILLMNIVSFSMPMAAYDNPAAYGGAAGGDLATWATCFAIADGKMRGLFTLLFGVSVAIVADSADARGANAAAIHYRRMIWLLVIGILHGLMIWYGDILVEYAFVGAILFLARRWPPTALFYAAMIFFLLVVVVDVWDWRGLINLRAAATTTGGDPGERAYWFGLVTIDPAALNEEVMRYRGGFTAVMGQRLHDLGKLTSALPYFLVESFGTALFGIGLYRVGYFTRWAGTTHGWLILIGYGGAVPAGFAMAILVAAMGFDPVTRVFAEMVNHALRPLIMLAHASAVICLLQRPKSSRVGRMIADRLAAAGRMALSNYLATSIAMTGLFYGTGLGLFGTLSRASLYPIVVLTWAAILLWSAPWLRRFRYGPVEWLWRSLARGAWQPMRLARH